MCYLLVVILVWTILWLTEISRRILTDYGEIH